MPKRFQRKKASAMRMAAPKMMVMFGMGSCFRVLFGWVGSRAAILAC